MVADQLSPHQNKSWSCTAIPAANYSSLRPLHERTSASKCHHSVLSNPDSIDFSLLSYNHIQGQTGWDDFPDFDLVFDFNGELPLQDCDTSWITNVEKHSFQPVQSSSDAVAGLYPGDIPQLPILASPQVLEITNNQSLAVSESQSPLSTSTFDDTIQSDLIPPVSPAAAIIVTAIECIWPTCSKSFPSMAEYK